MPTFDGSSDERGLTQLFAKAKELLLIKQSEKNNRCCVCGVTAACSTTGASKDFLTRGSRDEASRHFQCGSAPPDVERYTGFYKGVPEVRYNDAG